MKNLFILLTVALLTAVSCTFVHYNGKGGKGKRVVCGGPVESRSIDGLGDFSAIVVNGSADVDFVQGESSAVMVKANAEVFDYLDFKQEDGVLYLQAKDKLNIVAEEFDIRVTAPSLRSVVINGAADLDIKSGYRSGEDLTMVINGAGDFEIEGLAVPNFSVTVNGAGDISADYMDVESITVAINGAGEADLSGRALKADFSVSGAGAIDARALVCDNVTTHKSGIASIKLRK